MYTNIYISNLNIMAIRQMKLNLLVSIPMKLILAMINIWGNTSNLPIILFSPTQRQICLLQ